MNLFTKMEREREHARERESERERATEAQWVFCLQANGEACDCAHISAITQLTSDPAQCEETSHRETDEIDHKQVHNSKPPLTSSMRPSQTYLKTKNTHPYRHRFTLWVICSRSFTIIVFCYSVLLYINIQISELQMHQGHFWRPRT